jgi:hypothetical protein
MPSPFPGMNPYFEQDGIFEEFHALFVTELFKALVPVVRPAYRVHLEAQVYLTEGARGRERLVGPDLAAARTRHPAEVPAGGPALATVAAPVVGILPRLGGRQVTVRRLEIRGREEGDLITVVEVLSPCNKLAGQDRRAYLTKRRLLLKSPVHLVELDLLRGRGRRMPMQHLPPCDYCVMVSRAEDRPRVGLWPLRLAEPLPIIPVPLRSPPAAVQLDLQAALHRVYDAGCYGDVLYQGAPRPRLSAEQDAWARAFVPVNP